MSFRIRKLSDRPPRSRIWAGRIAAALTVAKPLLGFYHGWKDRHEKIQRKAARIGLLKRILLILIAALIALMLLVGVTKAIFSMHDLGIRDVISVAGTPLQTDQYGYTNILLMGQGHAEHDGKNLTDTIMVASMDPEGTQSTVLLSLPRDLYFLKTEKMGKGKLNSMYRDVRSYLIFQKGIDAKEASKQTLQFLAEEIGEKLGIEMHHAVKVDFIAFTKAVDTIDGVDIDVPYDIEDEEYPDENYGYEPFILKAGMRHLDGETALKYARSRSTTSDFGRSARQQQLLGALAQKAKEEGVLKDPKAITSFMNIMREHVETTMSLRELIGIAEIGQKLDRSKIIALQLNDRNALYDYAIEPGGMLYTPPRDIFDGASVLLPVSIPEFPVTWKQPQALVKLLMEQREIYVEKPTVSVLNAGAPPGSARKLATEFIRYGFPVSTIENAETKKRDTSMIVTGPEPDSVVTFFSNLMAIAALPAPEGLPAVQQERITIILGKDYRYTPLQDLVPNITENDYSNIRYSKA